MQTIVVVEDEKNIAEVVEMYLERAGFRTRWAPDLATARRWLDDPAVSCWILDLTLPDGDGVDFFRELRQRTQTPVLMVTARGEESDRILGLELGADDYVPKPFSPRELVARVKGVLRRAEPVQTQRQRVTIGSLTVDMIASDAQVDGRTVDLSKREFSLLAHICSSPGRVFTREQLLTDVWGYPEGDVDTRTVDVHVSQIRRKLGDANPIVTVRGVGYRVDL